MRRTVRTGTMRSHPGERGQAALELVGLLPLLLLGGMLVLQFGAAMWAMTSTNEAARQAARVYSTTESVGAARAAAEGSLPGGLSVASMAASGPGHAIRLTVNIPRVLPLPIGPVTREVVMP